MRESGGNGARRSLITAPETFFFFLFSALFKLCYSYFAHDSPRFPYDSTYLRWYSDWNHASRCILPGDQFRVYVAIQFVVDIIVADVFQGSAASGAFETLHVKILVLDSYEDTSAERERERERMID